MTISAELLYRPIRTLSFGERTKVMLAVLFSGENKEKKDSFARMENEKHKKEIGKLRAAL